MAVIKAVIIDDEKPGRDNLSAILFQYFKEEIVKVGEAGNIEEARNIIEETSPDLVFLDMELGAHTGFDLLDMFDPPAFQVVFVTAYEEYAVKAFRTIATDYILKPIDIQDLKDAIGKVAAKIEYLNNLKPATNSISEELENDGAQNQIRVTTVDGKEYIKFEDILYFQSINYYTKIVLVNKREILSSRHLKDYEESLKTFKFYRIHNSFIINTDRLISVVPKEGYYALLENDIEIKISRRRKDEFLLFLNK